MLGKKQDGGETRKVEGKALSYVQVVSWSVYRESYDKLSMNKKTKINKNAGICITTKETQLRVDSWDFSPQFRMNKMDEMSLIFNSLNSSLWSL